LSGIWVFDALVDGSEVSYAQTSVVLGRCPTPYFIEGRSCLLTLVTTRISLIEHTVVVLSVSMLLLFFETKRLTTGAILIAAVGAWRAGLFADGVPFEAVVVCCIVESIQRINRQRLPPKAEAQ